MALDTPVYYRRLRGYDFITTRSRRFGLEWDQNWTGKPLVLAAPGSREGLEEYVELGEWARLQGTELYIARGYAWDGPSGPARNTPNFMRGSLVHDALYQMMREGLLDHRRYRLRADKIMRQLCLEDGMTEARAWWSYQAVRIFGERAALPKPQSREKELFAPRRRTRC